MTSSQCYVCNNLVIIETKDDVRDKYYNIIGNKLYPGSHLCYICTHLTQKLWLFKTSCLNRGVDVQYGCEEELKWSLLFRLTRDTEKVHNLQVANVDVVILCSDIECEGIESKHIIVESVQRDVTEDLGYEDVPVQAQDDTEFSNDKFLNEIDSFSEYVNSYAVSHANEKGVGSEHSEDVDDDDNDDDDGGDVNEDDNRDDGDVECNNEVPDEAVKEEKVDSPAQEEDSTEQTAKPCTNSSFTKHVLSHEEQKAVLEGLRKEKKYLDAKFKCHSCALGFLFKDSYHSHMVRHEESNGQHCCNLCGLRFATQYLCNVHVGLHAERYVCIKCSAAVKRSHRTKHMTACWGLEQDPLSCHLCGKLFKDLSCLQQHLKRFHFAKTSKRTYSCNICAKVYTDRGSLRTHVKKHTSRWFECDQCPSTFGSPYTLNQHRKVHSSSAQEYCATCDTWYRTRKHLRQHLKNSVRHQQFSFECSLCARSWPTRRGLDSHMETTHSGLKPHACEHCPARYSTRKSLLRHARIHREYVQAKELICHLCGKSYRGKSKLVRHLKDVCERSKEEPGYAALFNDHSLC